MSSEVLPSLTLETIAEKLQLELVGNGDIEIIGIASLEDANNQQISFLSNAKYEDQLSSTQAAAVIIKAEQKSLCTNSAALISENPYLSFAQLTGLFNDAPEVSCGIHPSAVIAESAQISQTASIAANVVIGEYCYVGDNTTIEANCVIHDRCVLGDNNHLHANVVLYHNVRLGSNVRIHSHSTLGGDGFGNAPTGNDKGFWLKVYQLGGLLVGNDVEIGANTCIDRGALDDTIIEDGVRIDNLVHVAHNCIIGENTALAACVAMAGSTYIGKRCTFGGGVCIAGHITIADDVHVNGMGMVTGSIRESGQYASGTGLLNGKDWRKAAVRFGQLEKFNKRIKDVEKSLKQISSKD